MKILVLFFHSQAEKRAFLKFNRIAKAERVAETPASLTLREDGNEEFAKSVYVFQVERKTIGTTNLFLTRPQHDHLLAAMPSLLSRAFAEANCYAKPRWSLAGVELKVSDGTYIDAQRALQDFAPAPRPAFKL